MKKETFQNKMIDLKSNSLTYDKNEDKIDIDLNTNKTSLVSAAISVGALLSTSVYYWRRTKSLKIKNKYLKNENKNLKKLVEVKKGLKK